MGTLTDKYCIVGVGETPHMRPSNRTTLSMACEAVKKAMADAGLESRDIDGMTSYQAGDSTSSNHVSTSLGIRLNYSLDIFGGGSSTEALVGHAIGLLEAGYCKTIVIFRSMNGRSGRRMGGQAPSGPVEGRHQGTAHRASSHNDDGLEGASRYFSVRDRARLTHVPSAHLAPVHRFASNHRETTLAQGWLVACSAGQA